MRSGPSGTQLANAVAWTCTVESWQNGVLLAADVPVISGTLTSDSSQAVPERLTITVPEWSDGQSWVPVSFSDPLAKFGQQLVVDINNSTPVSAASWTIQLGTFQVQNWTHDDSAGTVSVEAVGLLQIAADAQFTSPQVPRTTDTFVSILTRLMPDGIPVNFDPALTDRAVAQSFQWDTDRLGAINDILDAWPARGLMDQYGTFQVLAPLPATPIAVATLTDGEGGTLIGSPAGDTRDQVYNVVVANSSATDDPTSTPIQAIAQQTTGPLAVSTYGAVVRFYSSPLITTVAQCQSAANALLLTSVLPANARVATIAPDPRFDIGDAVKIVQDPIGPLAATTMTGYVTAYSMPLTINDGATTLTIGVSS